MPYTSPGQMPPAFQHYSAHGQQAAMQAFNSALQQHGNESIAFAVAHHAARMAEHAALHGPAVPGVAGLPQSLR